MREGSTGVWYGVGQRGAAVVHLGLGGLGALGDEFEEDEQPVEPLERRADHTIDLVGTLRERRRTAGSNRGGA